MRKVLLYVDLKPIHSLSKPCPKIEQLCSTTLLKLNTEKRFYIGQKGYQQLDTDAFYMRVTLFPKNVPKPAENSNGISPVKGISSVSVVSFGCVLSN